jgi:hypothetical protein
MRVRENVCEARLAMAPKAKGNCERERGFLVAEVFAALSRWLLFSDFPRLLLILPRIAIVRL